MRVASAHARGAVAPFAAPLEVTRLTRATLVVLPLAAAAAWLLPAPSLLAGAVDLGAFALLSFLGLRALHQIDTASRPIRDVESAERLATLQPRRLAQYLPLPWRVAPFAIAGLAVILIPWHPSPFDAYRPFVALCFVLSTPVFAWLYDTWMRAEVSGGELTGENQAAASHARRRRIQRILAVDVALVSALAAVGHSALALNGTGHRGWAAFASVIGAVVAVVGCALALSSDLGRRRYRTVREVLR
jgi:hypothetical protein